MSWTRLLLELGNHKLKRPDKYLSSTVFFYNYIFPFVVIENLGIDIKEDSLKSLDPNLDSRIMDPNHFSSSKLSTSN
jgi:hypothetical protein